MENFYARIATRAPQFRHEISPTPRTTNKFPIIRLFSNLPLPICSLGILPFFFPFSRQREYARERHGRHARVLPVMEVGRGAFALKSGICKACAEHRNTDYLGAKISPILPFLPLSADMAPQTINRSYFLLFSLFSASFLFSRCENAASFLGSVPRYGEDIRGGYF